MGHGDNTRLVIEAGVGTITLDSPHNRNALSVDLLANLEKPLDQAEDSPNVRVAVLRAAGKTFCSGADLNSAGPAQGEAFARHTTGRADQASLDRVVREWAESLMRGAPDAMAATKRLVRDVDRQNLAGALDRMRAVSAERFGSAEAAEGVTAWQEKRDPSWVPSYLLTRRKSD